MNIQNLIKICFVVILLISCSKEDEYIPMEASAQQRTVELSCVDKDGNDLLADENFVNQIKIYGCLSKEKLDFDIKEIKKDGISLKYLRFAADLPNTKDMQFEGENLAYGKSQFIMFINKQKLKFSCLFKYESSGIPFLIGGNGIAIQSIEYKNQIINLNEHQSPLCLEIDKDAIKLR